MQTLTELRLKLADLQSRITGLESDMDECVEFIDTLTGGVPVPFTKRAPKAKARTNGSAGKAISPEVFRTQVRKHYTAQRGHRIKRATRRTATTPAMMNAEQALEVARRKYPNVSDPSPDTVTAQEAAQLLGCSDSNVRLLYNAGKLPKPTQELRRFGRSGRYHPAMVIPRQAVEAYKAQTGEPGTKPAPAKRKKKNGAVKPSEYKNEMKARRERSAKLLARFDRHEPRPIPPDMGHQGISVLVQHGYLKPQGGGYVRTAREFNA